MKKNIFIFALFMCAAVMEVRRACHPKIIAYHVLRDTLQVAVGKTALCAYSLFVIF